MTHRSGLAFKTKLQLKALKGLGTGPLRADDKKLLGITTPPKGAALVACAKGCASLIRSGRAATPAGKKEATIIIEAAANAHAALGKKLAAAAADGNPFRFKKETLADLQTYLDSLPSRLNTAISSLQSPDEKTLATVERFFKSNPKDPSPNLRSAPKVAESLLRVLLDVTLKMRFVDIERFVHYPTDRKVPRVKALFASDPNIVAIADGTDIYVHEIRFNARNPTAREASILHEIVHLTLGSREGQDTRYIHEGLEGLYAGDALSNADSIVAFVFVDDLALIGG